jgi:hypothetical protein
MAEGAKGAAAAPSPKKIKARALAAKQDRRRFAVPQLTALAAHLLLGFLIIPRTEAKKAEPPAPAPPAAVKPGEPPPPPPPMMPDAPPREATPMLGFLAILTAVAIVWVCIVSVCGIIAVGKESEEEALLWLTAVGGGPVVLLGRVFRQLWILILAVGLIAGFCIQFAVPDVEPSAAGAESQPSAKPAETASPAAPGSQVLSGQVSTRRQESPPPPPVRTWLLWIAAAVVTVGAAVCFVFGHVRRVYPWNFPLTAGLALSTFAAGAILKILLF